jgi:hypothetical protein
MIVDGCVKASGSTIGGTCSSDRRFKTDIQPLGQVLPRLAQLQPMHFNWRAAEFPGRHFGTQRSVGLIAQDVEGVFPELVSTDATGYKMVNYSELPYLMLQGIRELKAENDSLAGQVRDAHAELSRASAEKDRQILSLNRQIEDLRKAQEQTAVMVARLAQQQSGQSRVARANSSRHAPVKTGKPARTQVARAQF